MKIGKVSASALVHTGAPCSLISKQMWNRIQKVNKTARLDKIGESHITLKAVDQRQIKIKEK